MGKLIFLDVDGTIVDFNKETEEQYVPEDTITAIRAARANGHKVFICTGRSKAEWFPFLMDVGFDGGIGAAGGFIEYEGKTIYHKPMEEAAVKDIMQFCKENDVFYYLETNHGLYGDRSLLYRLKDKYKVPIDPDGPYFGSIEEETGITLNDINKISFTSLAVPFSVMDARYGKDFNLVNSSYTRDAQAGEISNKGVTKGTAIKFLTDYLGADFEDTFAFGDSMNDIEMLKNVKYPVAMGNFRDGIDKYSCFITKGMCEGGIEYAFKHFGLI